MNDHRPAIIHADADLLVIDKPAGVLSIPDGYDHSVPYLGRILEPAFGRLWVVHRLDKETSGVMVLARNAEAHRSLNAQFSERQVSKTYHAIVDDCPEWNEKVIDLPLRTHVGRRNRTTVDIGAGKQALTRFRMLERFTRFALVAAYPETGRTHQIRAHLYDMGISLLSDPLYGSGLRSPLIDRMALHAASLCVWHPTTGVMITFEAPMPTDFKVALAQLRGVDFSLSDQ